MESHIDEFGRIWTSREDSARLCKVWNAEHGQPVNSGHLIVREQWVADETSREIRGLASNNG